ncbi:MAG: glutamine--fructose-6-phosphate transaminase (isomerizing) [Planctomycetes bacterium]|nr:glutamine--fructose-6-phosphate transaminase (isomerizing) [Planctomycetota bacterium]
MCGIVGCASSNGPASGMLVEALKRLEYRGYDSAGVAILDPDSADPIHTVREVGKIRNLEAKLAGVEIRGRTGIGHTRWATHGRPSQENAHPHRDPTGAVVVVHNGIIENYLEIRRRLADQGAEFSSETDSEVIAHLIARNYDGDLAAAVRTSVRELAGAYAIAAIHKSEPDLVVGARQDSPLVVGIGDTSNYLASDVPALLPWTNQVLYLEDGQVVAVRPESVAVTDQDGNPVPGEVVEINWSPEQAEKGGFPHFMLKEIHEQPTTVSDALLGRLAVDDSEVVLDGLGLDADGLRNISRIALVACGTSWHAAQVGKFYLEQFARIDVTVEYASEFIYRDPVLDGNTLCIGISQSGETADTRAAMRRAKDEFDCHVLTICNVAGSSMAREADGVVLTHAGPEIGVASTKAFTGQLVCLLLFAVRLGQVRGTIPAETTRELCRGLRGLPQELEKVLRTSDAVKAVAEEYYESRDFLYIGRGVNYPIALEGALKLKEISYIHAEGYPAGEMKHGPIALIDDGMPILAIATQGRTYGTIAGNVEEARARGGKIIALVTPGDDRVAAAADQVLVVPRVHEALTPIVNIVPLQLLAYWTAVSRGTDVDQPRNLAKTVTVQ